VPSVFNKSNLPRYLTAILAIVVLLVSFQFRTLNFTGLLLGQGADDLRPWIIITNKVIRYLVNDLAALALLWVIFQRRDFLQLAVAVLLFGLIVLLPLYFVGFFYFQDRLGVTLSYLHRLVMNPTLMMLLIPLFYYVKDEERRMKEGKDEGREG
jgi:exosortase F-associated protein